MRCSSWETCNLGIRGRRYRWENVVWQRRRHVVARDEKVGGGVTLVVVGKDVVGGHVGCSEDGWPKRWSGGGVRGGCRRDG